MKALKLLLLFFIIVVPVQAETKRDTLDVLAYNIFMRSTLAFTDNQKQRSGEIPKKIKNYDVIIFSESFDNKLRKEVIENLKIYGYRYITNVIKNNSIDTTNGGVFIASKWPFDTNSVKQQLFKDCNIPDCSADKGVLYVKIKKYNRYYHIFGSHTQAGDGKSDAKVRQKQFKNIEDFIKKQNIPKNEVVIISGDLNVDMYDTNEYTNMLKTLNAIHPKRVGKNKYSFDSNTNVLASINLLGSVKPQYLDYVLYHKDYLQPILSYNKVIPLKSDKRMKITHWVFWTYRHNDLSDHYPVHGHFEFEKSNLSNPGTTLKEDCISFNSSNTVANNKNGSWIIYDGKKSLVGFENRQDDADKSVEIFKFYGLNQMCFVGRPNPSFTYFLKDGKSPKGAMISEDCIAFNPNKIYVQKIDNVWTIVEGNHYIFSFDRHENEAKKAVKIIKRHGFTKSCYVGRPNASLVYLRQ